MSLTNDNPLDFFFFFLVENTSNIFTNITFIIIFVFIKAYWIPKTDSSHVHFFVRVNFRRGCDFQNWHGRLVFAHGLPVYGIDASRRYSESFKRIIINFVRFDEKKIHIYFIIYVYVTVKTRSPSNKLVFTNPFS